MYWYYLFRTKLICWLVENFGTKKLMFDDNNYYIGTCYTLMGYHVLKFDQ